MGARVQALPPPSGVVPIGGLRCAECGAAPMIFVPGARDGVPHVWAFCGPLCAAGCGVAPWAYADLVDRAGWATRAELEAEMAPAGCVAG